MDGENNGKFKKKWMIGGTPIFGNIHMRNRPKWENLFQKSVKPPPFFFHIFLGGMDS